MVPCISFKMTEGQLPITIHTYTQDFDETNLRKRDFSRLSSFLAVSEFKGWLLKTKRVYVCRRAITLLAVQKCTC